MIDINYRNLAAIGLLMGAVMISSCSSAPPPRPPVDPEAPKLTYQKGSLWPGKTKKNMFFSDNKASAVGDIVTVHVVERTSASNSANTRDERASTNSFSLDTGAAAPTAFELKGESDFVGRGKTDRSDTFSATVSCIVKEILANGNMIIEGQKRMQINNEEQYIVVRGTIRPDDITYNNSILSTQIANADIMYTGEGGINGGRQPSAIARGIRAIWPF